MKKVILPLVETERSLMALQYVKKHFSVDQAQIIIVMVDENLGISSTRDEEAEALALVERKLELIASVLNGYDVVTRGFVGKPGAFICKMAREYNADYIVMNKSAQPDMLSMVGRTTEYVLNNAPCNVLIISENRMNAGEYKGLIYKKASATVNLRGQIGDKQSECLLPSVDADCNYHFNVTVGKIRFFHTAYDPETSNWDMPPSSDQLASVDIAAGESVDILVKANSVDGKADRIRIINRGMKQEAVFSYTITAAKKKAPEPMDIPAAPGSMPAPAVISLEDFPVPTVYNAEFEPAKEPEEEPKEEPVQEEPVHTGMDGTLTNLEDFMPDEIEIASVMDELSEEFSSMDQKMEPAASPMEAVLRYNEAEKTGRFSLEGLFDNMPEPTPIESVASDTLRTDFGDLHKDFTTGQMDYVEDTSVELDDFI